MTFNDSTRGRFLETISWPNVEYFTNNELDWNIFFSNLLSFSGKLKSISMHTSKPGDPLFKAIMQERSLSRHLSLGYFQFKNLSTADSLMEYGYGTWALRDVITKLVLCDQIQQAHFCASGSVTDISKRLELFPHLKHISFIIMDYCSTYFLDILSSIAYCNTLESVEIELEKNFNTCPINTTSNNNNNHPSMKTNSNIKIIKETRIIPKDAFFIQLMNKFKELDELPIKFYDFLFKKVSAETCLNFITYMYHNIKSFDVQMMAINSNLLQTVNSFLDSIVFYGYLDIGYKRGSRPKIGLVRSKNTGNLLHLILKFNHAVYHSTLPHQIIIEKFGKSLERIHLDFDSLYFEHDQSHHKHLHGYFFDFILKNCPTLKYFGLNNMKLDHCDPSLANNDSVKVLRLFQCDINDGSILAELCKRLLQLTHLLIHDSLIVDQCSWTFYMSHISLTTLCISDPYFEYKKKNFYCVTCYLSISF